MRTQKMLLEYAPNTIGVFLAKLELCRRMVVFDPFEQLGDGGPFDPNEFLPDHLHKIWLRMCGGNIVEVGVPVVARWAKELGWELVPDPRPRVGDDDEQLFGLRDESGAWIDFEDAPGGESGTPNYGTLNHVLAALSFARYFGVHDLTDAELHRRIDQARHELNQRKAARKAQS